MRVIRGYQQVRYGFYQSVYGVTAQVSPGLDGQLLSAGW